MATKPRKSTKPKKPTKSTKKSTAKKVYSKSKKMSAKQTKTILIAILAIVLIVALVFGVMFLVAPGKMKAMWDSIFGNHQPPSSLEGDIMDIRFLDVGQGDCIIVRLPNGKNMIIDAGGEKSRDEKRAEDVILDTIESLEITTFDYMIATHSDADHVDYLDSVLRVTQVNKVFRPAYLSKSEPAKDGLSRVTTDTYDNFINAAKDEPNCEIVENIGLLELDGTNYDLTIYAPPKREYEIDKVGKEPDAKEKNKVSPFIYLTYGGRTTVFTGDSESDDGGNGGEEMLINEYGLAHMKLDCDVLKVGHHGSEPSAGSTFLNTIDVEYAVISVGVGNSHKHPRPELLGRLDDYRDQVPDGDGIGIQKTYRTDVNGTVILKVGLNGGMQWNTAYN